MINQDKKDQCLIKAKWINVSRQKGPMINRGKKEQ